MPDLRTFAKTVSDLWDQPGAIAMSGRASWENPSRFYFLGMNPGGDPKIEGTIKQNIDYACNDSNWSAYDERNWPRQNVRLAFKHLVSHLDDHTPCSNAIFTRSRMVKYLPQKDAALRQCWPFHEAVIAALQVTNVICVGHTGVFVRDQLGAEIRVDQRPAEGGAIATHEVHRNKAGKLVFTLIYPKYGHEWVMGDTPTGADPTQWVLDKARETSG